VAEPQLRIHRVALVADLQVQLRFRAAAGITCGGDDRTGCDTVTGMDPQLIVVAVQAQVPLAMIDDREQPRPGASRRR